MPNLLSRRAYPAPPSINTTSCNSSTYCKSVETDKLSRSYRECIIFSTYAVRDDNNNWCVHARGWVLSHNSSNARRALWKSVTTKLAKGKPIDAEVGKRLKYFVANNKCKQRLRVEVVGLHEDTTPFTNTSTINDKVENDEDYDTDSNECPESACSSSSSISDAISALEPLINDRRDSDDSGFHEPLKNTAQDYVSNDSDQYGAKDSRLCRPTNPLGRSRPGLSPKRHTSEEHFDTWNESTLCSFASACSTLAPNSPSIIDGFGATVQTDGNGFFSAQFMLPDAQVEAWKRPVPCRKIRIACTSLTGSFDTSFGFVNLIERKGISIISDIDDTIKDTGILKGGRSILRSTFFKSPKAVPGMAETYATWYKLGGDVHYVSNSPFQLISMLERFREDNGFPPGSFHLREVGIFLARLIETPGKAKRDAILRIMDDYPERQFVLVGDSGEIDLEIYTGIAKERPGRVLKIFVRDVTTSFVKNRIAKSQKSMQKERQSASLLNRTSTLSSLFKRRRSSQSNSSSLDVVSSLDATVSAPELLGAESTMARNARPSTSLTSSYSSPPIPTSSASEVDALLVQLEERLEKARSQCDAEVVLFENSESLSECEKTRKALWGYLDASV